MSPRFNYWQQCSIVACDLANQIRLEPQKSVGDTTNKHLSRSIRDVPAQATITAIVDNLSVCVDTSQIGEPECQDDGSESKSGLGELHQALAQ